MTPRERARRYLLRLAAETGDAQILAAAELLELPPPGLLEHVRGLKRRGNPANPTREAVVGPRLLRMALAILSGEAASVHGAAVQEVNRHGIGAHASEATAIKVLAETYRAQAKTREADARCALLLHTRSTAAIGTKSAGKVRDLKLMKGPDTPDN